MKKLLLCAAIASLGITADSYAQILTEDFEAATPPALPSTVTGTVTGGGRGWQTYGGSSDYTINASAGAVIAAHTKFAVVNDQIAHNNNPAKMESAGFSLASTSGVYLVFDYWYKKYRLTATNRTEIAWVEFSTDNGASYTTIDSLPAFGGGWTTRAIALTGTSATCKLRFCYSDKQSGTTDTAGIIGMALDNIKVLTPPANDIALTAVGPVAGNPNGGYAKVGTNFGAFTGNITNLGGTPISTFNWGYKVGSAAWVTGSQAVTVAPYGTATFTCTPAAPCTAAGQQTVTIYVGVSGDAIHTNDTMTTTVVGVNTMPTKRPLFEEPTGTWCGFCVRGIVYMDSIWRAYPGGVSVVSVHNSDPMASDNGRSTNHDAFMGNLISGYPSLVSDRIDVDDPSSVFSIYGILKDWFGFADMKMTTTTTSSTVTVNATVTPATNLSGDYRLELILTEDRVSGTTSGWEQHNYYNGGGRGALQNTEYNFVTLPATIPATTMKYDFVSRWTVPDLGVDPNGVAGSLPATMTAGTAYNYSFNAVNIAANWHSNKMRAIVVLIDNTTGSITKGMALNTVNTRWFLGVSDVKAGIQGVRIFPNPASQDANMIFDLTDAGKVSISVIDIAGRTVYAQSGEMGSGEQHINIPVADLAAGIYNVIVATDKGSVTARLSVAK